MHNTTTKDKVFQFILSILMVFFIGSFSGISQTNMTKIKDGTISGSSAIPGLGTILELESTDRGFLMPRLTVQQRDAIPMASRTDGLAIYNTSSGCFNYWSTAQNDWLSMCGTLPQAQYEISALNCDKIQISGKYKQGDLLKDSHYLIVPITVTQAGTYDIMATTSNGYYFSAKGTFPSLGNYNIILKGTGIPSVGYDAGNIGDLVTIYLNEKPSICQTYIEVEKANVNYEVICADIQSPMGSYMIGMALNQSNKIVIKVNVIADGYWNISTNTVNGYSFKGTGTFNGTGEKTIELIGNGAPINSGQDSFVLTTNSATTPNVPCQDIVVNVLPLKFSVDCSNVLIQGEYNQDQVMLPENKVTIKVNVKATGTTTIRTNEVGGIYFTSGLLNFDTLTQDMDVTLSAVGTPTLPGNHSFTLEQVPGMEASCSFNLTVESQPISYTMNCQSIVMAGSYIPGKPLDSSNTMSVPVVVDYPGNYSISTNTVNGVTFSASGTFTQKGNQTVVLTASGIPAIGGRHRFILTSNTTVGTTTCNKDVDFLFDDINVLGLGNSTAGGFYFQPGNVKDDEAPKVILKVKQNFSPTGVVKIDNINITNGKNALPKDLVNYINDNKIDVIIIGYNYKPDKNQRAVLLDFVKNKKGVLIHAQEDSTTSIGDMIQELDGSTGVTATIVGSTALNIMENVDDPLLNGPFGDLRSQHTGNDHHNPVFVKGFSNNFIPLGSVRRNLGNTNDPSEVWMLRHKTLGYVFVGDSGWLAGRAGHKNTLTGPSGISTTGTPIAQSFYKDVEVYNSILYANTMAWAIEYVQKNTNKDYQVSAP